MTPNEASVWLTQYRGLAGWVRGPKGGGWRKWRWRLWRLSLASLMLPGMVAVYHCCWLAPVLGAGPVEVQVKQASRYMGKCAFLHPELFSGHALPGSLCVCNSLGSSGRPGSNGGCRECEDGGIGDSAWRRRELSASVGV